jgi:hypothetical protein
MEVVETLRWVAVESNVFTAAAYRSAARQMYLRFGDGDIYRYFDVPSHSFKELLAADSKGRYFSQRIRNRFHHEKVHRGSHARVVCDARLAEQLSDSIVRAEARARQAREAAQTAGVSEATC